MSKSIEQQIHEITMEIMQEVGVQIHSPKACEILKSNGIRVEGNIAYFTEDQVWEWVKKAPREFTIYARNPKYNVTLGNGTTNYAASYGCAFMDDKDGNRRRGTMDDFIKCMKLVEAEEIYDINGGILIQPSDVPEVYGAIWMFYATLLHSEKAIMLATGFKEEMELVMEAAAAVFGGKEALIEKPRSIALINTVSPLQLDERMLENLMILVEYGQPVILCPAAMLGATSQISRAGTVASGAAESLAGIILAQMIRPGAPVVFGIQSTAADMRGGVSFACAAPEGCSMQGFSENLGKFYGVPSRGGGCQTDAPFINAQAGYESMLTAFSASHYGINITMEAGGIMDSVNALSYEKLMVDYEIIREVKEALKPISVEEDTENEMFDLDEIKEIAHTGTFVTSDTTMDNFQSLYSPVVGSRVQRDPDYFEKSIDATMDRLLKYYDSHKPVLDADLQAKMKEILLKSGLEEKFFEYAENN